MAVWYILPFRFAIVGFMSEFPGNAQAARHPPDSLAYRPAGHCNDQVHAHDDPHHAGPHAGFGSGDQAEPHGGGERLGQGGAGASGEAGAVYTFGQEYQARAGAQPQPFAFGQVVEGPAEQELEVAAAPSRIRP